MKDEILKILKENWHYSYNDAADEIMELINKNTHGGKRKGAGRKKKPVPSAVINFRVPENRKEELKQKLKEYLNSLL
jgi:hypothetical protein